MLKEAIKCRKCYGCDIVRNGYTIGGKQKIRCKICKWGGTLHPTQSYSSEEKERILRLYSERISLRGIQRIYGISCSTLLRWIKKSDNAYSY